MTLRHDILKGIWRHIARRAGVAASKEARLGPLRVSPRSLWRRTGEGGIILELPNVLTVANVWVIHPTAHSYARGAVGAVSSRRQRCGTC